MNLDIEDYIDEASTRILVQELKKREGYENIDATAKDLQAANEAMKWIESLNKLSIIGRVKFILNLKPYATKEEIINEINDL